MIYQVFAVLLEAALIYEEASQHLANFPWRHLIAIMYPIKLVTFIRHLLRHPHHSTLAQSPIGRIQKVLREDVLETFHLVDVVCVADFVIVEALLQLLTIRTY